MIATHSHLVRVAAPHHTQRGNTAQKQKIKCKGHNSSPAQILHIALHRLVRVSVAARMPDPVTGLESDYHRLLHVALHNRAFDETVKPRIDIFHLNVRNFRNMES